jgi:Holliday junction resolvasome RuvABC ATP-dependent DNA helicase subunit
MQTKKVFWGPDDPWGDIEPTHEEKLWAISQDNPESPFYKFIGNTDAVLKLQTVAYDALSKPDHACNDMAFAIFGPASSGKTTLAKLFSEVVDLPFVEIHPKSVTTLDSFAEEISMVLEKSEVPLVESEDGDYCLPPCVIFIDEVHSLSNKMEQGLLKATERKDCILATESGMKIDCEYACWMIATTDEGMLFDAFRSRFSTINLTYLSQAEIAKIIQIDHPDLSMEICRLIASYTGKMPRKALEFAAYMCMSKKMRPEKTWEEIAKDIARREGIDEYGMSNVTLTILKALRKEVIPRQRMPNIVGRKMEEVERYIMPALLTSTEDEPALVQVSRRGYVITEAGLEELNKRKI